MFGLPKDFNTAPLVERTLESICFNENQINFHFNEKLTISVESSVRYQKGPTRAPETIEVPALQSDLMHLLGHTTTKVFGDGEWTLTFEFEDGQILQCLDDSPQYESYHIYESGDRTIV
jgi:hypothetical protein